MEAAIGGLQSTTLDLSTADRTDLLDTVGLEVARLRRLVENLLDLSRLQAGAAVAHAELWPVEELLARAAADTASPGRMRIEVPRGLPAAKVDAAQVQRALANLIENALKFSEADAPVELTAKEQGGRVVLEVLDRGRGIDAGEAVTLLEPFVRSGAGGLTGGSGLGLAIANGFVGVNGGALSLEVRPGGGTCARITLPAERVPEAVSR
jgi:two-component system sensor histidine kinase KdpD